MGSYYGSDTSVSGPSPITPTGDGFEYGLAESTATQGTLLVAYPNYTSTPHDNPELAWFAVDSPNPGSPSGNYSVKLEITSGSADIDIRIKLHRVGNLGTSQADSGWTSTQTASSSLTFDSTSDPSILGSLSLGTWASDDWFAIEIEGSSDNEHGAESSVTFGFNTSASEIVVPWTVGGTNASVSPTVVTSTSSQPAPTLATGAALTATTVTSTSSQPAPTVAAGLSLTATAVDSTSSVPAPTVSVADTSVTATVVTSTSSQPAPTLATGAALTASSVTSTASVPTPTVSATSAVVNLLLQGGDDVLIQDGSFLLLQDQGSGDVSVNATVVTSTSSQPAPTLATGAALTATVVTSTGSVGSPTVATGAAVTAVAVDSTGSVGTATVATGAAVTAVTVDSTGSVGTATVATGAALTATVVTSTGSVGSPTLATGAAVTATVVTSTSSVPAPTVSVADTELTATAVTSTGSVPAPTLATGAAVTATVVTSTGSVPTPTVATDQDASVNATVVTSTGSVGTATVATGAAVTATAVTSTGSVPAPTVTTGASVNLSGSVSWSDIPWVHSWHADDAQESDTSFPEEGETITKIVNTGTATGDDLDNQQGDTVVMRLNHFSSGYHGMELGTDVDHDRHVGRVHVRDPVRDRLDDPDRVPADSVVQRPGGRQRLTAQPVRRRVHPQATHRTGPRRLMRRWWRVPVDQHDLSRCRLLGRDDRG
jgi:hypothetical protein